MERKGLLWRHLKPYLEIVMNVERNKEYGIALLRVSLGIMFIAHSVVLKHFTFTLPGTAGYFESIGLPGFLAYVVFGMEAVGGILLVLGVRTREVAAALIPILVGAFWVHSGNGWVFSNAGGGWEYPLYLIVLSGAQVLLGEGAFALSHAPISSQRGAARHASA
jgi:putative oxidoreductase